MRSRDKTQPYLWKNSDNIGKVPLVMGNIFTINGTNLFSGPNIGFLSPNDILFPDDHAGQTKENYGGPGIR